MNHDQNTVFGNVAALLEIFKETKKKRQSRQPAYVLVVEDDSLTQRVVTNSLKENYAMVSAVNAHEAVSSYMMYAPDVVFLDIGLPDVSGFTVLDQIMLIDPEAFIVMFSSCDYPDNIEKAIKAGAKGFVSKPFYKEEMYRYIQGSSLHHQKYN